MCKALFKSLFRSHLLMPHCIYQHKQQNPHLKGEEVDFTLDGRKNKVVLEFHIKQQENFVVIIVFYNTT